MSLSWRSCPRACCLGCGTRRTGSTARRGTGYRCFRLSRALLHSPRRATVAADQLERPDWYRHRHHRTVHDDGAVGLDSRRTGRRSLRCLEPCSPDRQRARHRSFRVLARWRPWHRARGADFNTYRLHPDRDNMLHLVPLHQTQSHSHNARQYSQQQAIVQQYFFSRKEEK